MSKAPVTDVMNDIEGLSLMETTRNAQNLSLPTVVLDMVAGSKVPSVNRLEVQVGEAESTAFPFVHRDPFETLKYDDIMPSLGQQASPTPTRSWLTSPARNTGERRQKNAHDREGSPCPPITTEDTESA